MKSFVSTVVGGMLGLAALYVVGRISYRIGHEMAEAECRYDELRRQSEAMESSPEGESEPSEPPKEAEEEPICTASPAHKTGKLGLMMGLRRLAGGKDSVIGNVIRNPEAHRIEAFVEGKELKVNIKPRTA